MSTQPIRFVAGLLLLCLPACEVGVTADVQVDGGLSVGEPGVSEGGQTSMGSSNANAGEPSANGGSSATGSTSTPTGSMGVVPEPDPPRDWEGTIYRSVYDDTTATTPGFVWFRDEVQPLLASECGSCHMGARFSFASLERAGEEFTEEETIENYKAFFPMLSLDNPPASRLLGKVVEAPFGQDHGGGVLLSGEDDPVYETLLSWVTAEAEERCLDCGVRATQAFIAYVDQPKHHWAIRRRPLTLEFGTRTGARIMMQPIDPATGEPNGEAVPFLPDSFCGPNGECDFGHISSSHAGDRLVFECRLSLDGGEWINQTWNACIAEVGEDGRAVNPRFVRPEGERHEGWTYARSDPFLILNGDGAPNHGIHDKHARMRQFDDRHPVFSPDDTRVVVSSRSADPRTGIVGTTTYHGTTLTNNIISMSTEGERLRTLYFNEGGTADFPTYRRNGNLAVHIWNLERMDRHLYIQATQDGMMELPVLFGRIRGTNMWGKLTETAGGGLIGIGGRRRGSVEKFQAFYADHTLGTGLDDTVQSYVLLDPEIESEMVENFSYCDAPPDGPNCSTARFYNDAQYSPYGGALITYNPSRTYYKATDTNDHEFQEAYSGERMNWEALDPWLPELQIAEIDPDGTVRQLIVPPAGRAYRYPAWVGKRQPPIPQETTVDETKNYADLHIADFRLWLSMRINVGRNKVSDVAQLDNIVAVRVTSKMFRGNACTNDDYPVRHSTYTGVDAPLVDHPTHLGIVNATGYLHYAVPESMGGDAYGDVPLESDGSVFLRVPSAELLLFQGIDANGHLVSQHSRVFALPPGVSVDTSVKREQYRDQCMQCHGTIDSGEYLGLAGTDQLAAVLSYDTEAKAKDPVDLLDEAVDHRPLTFLAQLRPMLDEHCVSCHSGDAPAAELTLTDTYSSTANYPAGRWAQEPYTNANYLGFVPEESRVPGYNWSTAREYSLELGTQRDAFISTPYEPLGELSQWDPGYQMLWIPSPDSAGRSYYLSDYEYGMNLGRGGRYSDTSYLLEVLTGRDMSKIHSYAGSFDHVGLLDEGQIRTIMALIDNGFPFMSSCADKTVPSGPNAGLPWGDPEVTFIR